MTSSPTTSASSSSSLSRRRVLILTTFGLDEYIIDALRAGASGFLLKGGEPTDLLKAIRVVAAATRC